MNKQRGDFECKGAILQCLLKGPSSGYGIRRETNLCGTTLKKHLTELVQLDMIIALDNEKIESYIREYKYYRLTAKGKSTAKMIQLTLEALYLPEGENDL